MLWVCLPLDENRFPYKTQVYYHTLDWLQDKWVSKWPEVVYIERKRIYFAFPSDLSVEVGKVSILRLLEWLQAVCWSWVSLNGFLCPWFSKLLVSISFCLCCSGTSLPTVTLIMEGDCLPTLWAGCHLNLLISKQKDKIKSAKEQNVSCNW